MTNGQKPEKTYSSSRSIGAMTVEHVLVDRNGRDSDDSTVASAVSPVTIGEAAADLTTRPSCAIVAVAALIEWNPAGPEWFDSNVAQIGAVPGRVAEMHDSWGCHPYQIEEDQNRDLW